MTSHEVAPRKRTNLQGLTPEARREHMRARDRAYRATRKDLERNRLKAWRLAHPEAILKQNRSRVFRKYGLTTEQYAAMLAAQGNRCAICNADSPGRNRSHFYVDHDHVTGLVRGLLCQLCNTGLGSMRDEPRILERALYYVQDSIIRGLQP